MAIVAGVVCIAVGLVKLGFVTELLSKPIRYGYMNGIALTVLLSQTPKLFGFSVDAEGPLRHAWGFVDGVRSGETNVAALIVGAGTLATILLLQRWPRLPAILIARRGRDPGGGRVRPRRRARTYPCSARCRKGCRRFRCRGSAPATFHRY